MWITLKITDLPVIANLIKAVNETYNIGADDLFKLDSNDNYTHIRERIARTIVDCGINLPWAKHILRKSLAVNKLIHETCEKYYCSIEELQNTGRNATRNVQRARAEIIHIMWYYQFSGSQIAAATGRKHPIRQRDIDGRKPKVI